MKYILLLYVGFIFTIQGFSQNGILNGKITDATTKEPMPGVSVVINETTGTSTDVNGFYSISLAMGQYNVTYRLIGYTSEKKQVTIKGGEISNIDISLYEESSMLNEVVVSAGKFEQKISDVTVSIQTLKPSMIENTNTTSIDQAIQKLPGVQIMDGQASIRGGSGFNYGAGSRVLLLVDDLPMLSGAASDVKWNFAPVENIEQVEVIKGASSALYGSAALNGIINIRTAYPGIHPQTKLIITNGLYMNPKRDEIIWWGKTQPSFSSTQFSHRQKIGNFDLVLGGNVLVDNGYRLNNSDQILRFNINTRYRDKKIEGLSYGINANFMSNRGQEFLLWQDADSGVYKPSTTFSQQFNNSRMNIDPYIVYHTKNDARHSLKARFFETNNINNTGQSNKDYLYYSEYQFQKHFKNDLTFTTGVTGTYCETTSEIYGKTEHFSASGGVFAQADKKINLLSLSLGARWETFKLDEDAENSNPVFRTGASYLLTENSSVRASFGQGFRYPSIAEKYTYTTVGALKIFPNDTLHPETGWSSEIGFKQGFKINNWNAIIDIAGFWTQYHNMIEFTFGQHYPNDSIAGNPTLVDYLNYTGFKAYNISNAQINGFEITLAGKGKFFGLPSALLCGYTYTNPIDLDANRDSLKSTKGDILKYRFYHSAKFDFEVTYKKFTVGVGMMYNSFMINVDKAFEDSLRGPNGKPIIMYGKPILILPGLKEYREKHNKGDIVIDLRVALQATEKSRVSIILKNVLNREYMTRPGDVQAPRNIAIQYSLRF
jgi:outer membrane cobalamin receptor